MVQLLSNAIGSVLSTNRKGIVFWILLLNGESTNVLVRLLVINNQLRIARAFKEQNLLKRKNISANFTLKFVLSITKKLSTNKRCNWTNNQQQTTNKRLP